jgi:hypothetical protein
MEFNLDGEKMGIIAVTGLEAVLRISLSPIMM